MTTQTPSSNANFTLGEPFKVRLTMLSDWHIGTGAGRPGNVDRLVARDADNFPFVPAKTLNGIWRDAAERLAYGLDEGKPNGIWAKWVDYIFGSQPNRIAESGNAELRKLADAGQLAPGISCLQITPAHLSKNLCQRLLAADDRHLIEALTFVKPGIAVDKSSGISRPDFLRFEEMGRAGMILEAEAKLCFKHRQSTDNQATPQTGEDETQQLISALLIVSAQLIERIGGKRRRGAGECRCELIATSDDAHDPAIDVASAIEYLRSKKDDVPPIPVRYSIRDSPNALPSTSDTNANRDDSETGDDWMRLDFSLLLLTPVSIVTATLGNVSESLDFVPGTYLLPHITKCFSGGLQQHIRAAITCGEFQVSPATIQIGDERGLPVPRVLAYHKLGGGFDNPKTIYNRFLDKVESKIDNAQITQIKLYREGYINEASLKPDNQNTLPSYQTVTKSVLMHNTIEDESQRPTKEVGGIYSREAIAANRTLGGEIRLTRRLAEQIETEFGAVWYKKLNADVRLGTSRKDDYGLAKFRVEEPKTIEEQVHITNDNEAFTLTIYFASDALVRNSRLRQTYDVHDLAALLSKHLRLDASQGETITVAAAKPDCINVMLQTRRIESWNEAWSFPRPSLIAIAAGSCVRFKLTLSSDNRKPDIERNLNRMMRIGIGERRGEGYGEISFNPPLLTEKINKWRPAAPPDKNMNEGDANAPLNEAETRTAKIIEDAAWREAVRVAVLKIADDEKLRTEIFGFEIDVTGNAKRAYPPMSQVGGLRSAMTRLHNASDKNASDKNVVYKYLKHLKETRDRVKRWDKNGDKSSAKSKIETIEVLIENRIKVWEHLKLPLFTQPKKIVTDPDVMQQEMWAEAVRALFDACARAHKRDSEKQSSDSKESN